MAEFGVLSAGFRRGGNVEQRTGEARVRGRGARRGSQLGVLRSGFLFMLWPSLSGNGASFTSSRSAALVVKAASKCVVWVFKKYKHLFTAARIDGCMEPN